MTISHILVPYDGSNDADRAFDEALKITKKYSCTLSLVSCFYESNVGCFAWADLYENFRKIILDKLAKLENKSKNEQISFSHYFIETGNVVDNIIFFSENNDVDMIIIGSQKLQGFKKFLQGSISEEVQKHAKCIVKIV